MNGYEITEKTVSKVLDKYLDRTFKGERNLKGVEREVIRLRYFEELSYKEIGEILNKSASTIRTLMKRSLSKLRESNEFEFYEENYTKEMGYSMVDYSSITNPPKECLLCGLSMNEDDMIKGQRRIHRECSFERMTFEMAIHKGKTPRDISYRKVWSDEHGEIPKGMHIHHIDGDHSNNSIENLTLVTPQQHYDIHKEQGDHLAAYLIKKKFL